MGVGKWLIVGRCSNKIMG